MKSSEISVAALSFITFGLSIYYENESSKIELVEDLKDSNLKYIYEKFHFVEDERWLDLKIKSDDFRNCIDIVIRFPYEVDEDKIDDTLRIVNKANSCGRPCSMHLNFDDSHVYLESSIYYAGYYFDDDPEYPDYSDAQLQATCNLYAGIFAQAMDWWREVNLVSYTDITAVNLLNERSKK